MVFGIPFVIYVVIIYIALEITSLSSDKSIKFFNINSSSDISFYYIVLFVILSAITYKC